MKSGVAAGASRRSKLFIAMARPDRRCETKRKFASVPSLGLHPVHVLCNLHNHPNSKLVGFTAVAGARGTLDACGDEEAAVLTCRKGSQRFGERAKRAGRGKAAMM